MKTDACFLCSTPYQILIAVSILHHFGYCADVVILNEFSDAKDVADQLSKLKIFNKIYLFPEKNGAFDKLNFLQKNRIIKRDFSDNVAYDNVFCSNARSSCALSILACIYGNNPSAQLYRFEDGTITYSDAHFMSVSFMTKLKLFLIGSLGVAKQLALFKLICFDNSIVLPEVSKDHEVIRIPQQTIGECKNKYNEIFKYHERVSKFDEKVIIFDVMPYSAESKNRKIAECYALINETFKGNVIYKKHPRDSRKLPNDVKSIYARTPSELLCMNEDVENKVMIAESSTAVVSPKLMFDQEPCVILLYLIITGGKRDGYVDFFENVKKMYRDPDKFMIPSDMEELRTMLESVKKQLGQGI